MRAFGLWLLCWAAVGAGAAEPPLVVGSKKFTEGVVLGEVLRLTLEAKGLETRHRAELGGTRILWGALEGGDVDAYVEYTGTLEQEILRRGWRDDEELRALLAAKGVGLAARLGFSDSYALGMRRERARELGIRRLSDLRAHPELRYGFGEEFWQRPDGWPGVRRAYDLPARGVRAVDHDIAYRALVAGDLDVTDFYTTDAEIAFYDLIALEDDRGHFPPYEAVVLYRLETARRRPAFLPALAALDGKIDAPAMIAMNARAKFDRLPAERVAAEFLGQPAPASDGWRPLARSVWRRTVEHFTLVSISLTLAILLGVPLGYWSAARPRAGDWVVGLTGAVQTIPALALLVMLIYPLRRLGLGGIGDVPATVALVLYALLPIVRGAHLGFSRIPADLRDAADVLDLRRWTRLRVVEWPLARPAILSGVKTSAVMSVGFATLGALVGAGGYGRVILAGVRLDDYGLILQGALPAVLMALAMQLFWDRVESRAAREIGR